MGKRKREKWGSSTDKPGWEEVKPSSSLADFV